MVRLGSLFIATLLGVAAAHGNDNHGSDKSSNNKHQKSEEDRVRPHKYAGGSLADTDNLSWNGVPTNETDHVYTNAPGAHVYRAPKGKKNVILMISDGFGPASEYFARSFYQYKQGLSFETQLPLDELLTGSIRTRAIDSLITDSAASGTAYSCGIKSFNDAIAVDHKGEPCGTVLEGAKKLGYATGLVTTSRITHATPAVFSSHVTFRDWEDLIAQQQIGDNPLGRQVDLLMGGGRCYFTPQSTEKSCREDDRNLIEEAQSAGFSYIEDRAGFDGLNNGSSVDLPLLALFTQSHMSYEIDRKASKEPSLAEMSLTALNALNKAQVDQEEGFFIMIEGARIDHAAHNNDPIGHLHDILAYQEAVMAVRNWVDEHPESLLISTSDHECGGLALGRQANWTDSPFYGWYPSALANATNSTEVVGSAVAKMVNHTDAELRTYLNQTVLTQWMGIDDATTTEIDSLICNRNTSSMVTYQLSDMLNRRAAMGWSTHGHSGVDVNLYAYGAAAEAGLFIGNHENIFIGKFIEDYLGLDLHEITTVLNNGTFPDPYSGADLANFTRNLPVYDHDHRGLVDLHASCGM
ncbi:alkaline phosphatase-like protein [Saitoella complicata NRRL Y-17804]|nr:alkaline phosphatase-like protein [Saitoella complicata NRRL Y-17804]ODQ56426.1 alkaline phosphatase-like protein [Saitoella complicata NRRL Y-17804]